MKLLKMVPGILKDIKPWNANIYKKKVETPFKYLNCYEIKEEYYLFYFISESKTRIKEQIYKEIDLV